MVLELDWRLRLRWVSALGVGQIVLSQRSLPWCPSHCIPHRQRGCSAVCGVGTDVVPSFGSGVLTGPCSWKIPCGAMGKKNPTKQKTCQSRVNIEVKLGDPSSFTLLPSDPIFYLSSLLCRTLGLLLKEEYFSIPVFPNCDFLASNPAIFDKQERKEFSHKFLRSNMKWGGLSLTKWEKLLMCFLLNHV